MKKLLIAALLLSFVVGTLSVSVLAQEQERETDKPKRAAKNTLLGWTEIPKAITNVTKETDNPFLGITVGLLKGIANTFARTTSGIADTVTLPRSDTDPAIKAEMVPTTSESTK